MAGSTPIHVCHVLLSLRPGGLENGVVNVVNGLDARRFRSTVCCLQELGEFALRIADSRVEKYAMGLRGGNDLRLPLRLAWLFRSIGVDIVHTRNAEAGFYGIAAAKIGRIGAIVHSEHGRTFPEKPHRAWLQRKLMSRIDGAFAVSETLRSDLIREIGIDESRIGVIYNGVNLQSFAASHDRDGDAAREIVIGSVGRLVGVKNYSLMLRAFAALPRTLRTRLLLVGDGPMREELERLADDLAIAGRVEFAGHSEQVPLQLRKMDIFVLPSLSEGLSNTLMEAMASGVAAVASRVGGNPELISSGNTGLLFESQDQQGLTDCLAMLIGDPGRRQAMALAGAAKMRAQFSLPGMIERYENLYTKVMQGHPS